LGVPATSDDGLLVLRHGEARLVLDADHGGAIREFRCRGRDILRPTPAGAGKDPLDLACFPMVPFVNRIARGRFEFGGREVQLANNAPQIAHPIHGEGWRRQWTVTQIAPDNARLEFEGGGGKWPWRYLAEQHFALGPDTLSIELSAENLGVEPMPLMLGLHPYFIGASRTRLLAGVPKVWHTDQAALPTELAAAPPDWGFDPARALKNLALDHCFASWNGTATLYGPQGTLHLQATNCRFLHIYVPEGQDFFCLEPQTAATGALGRGGAEVEAVLPGERRAMSLRINVGTP